MLLCTSFRADFFMDGIITLYALWHCLKIHDKMKIIWRKELLKTNNQFYETFIDMQIAINEWFCENCRTFWTVSLHRTFHETYLKLSNIIIYVLPY